MLRALGEASHSTPPSPLHRGEKVPQADGAPESVREQEGESPFWSNVH
jgi:hypothetical protein